MNLFRKLGALAGMAFILAAAHAQNSGEGRALTGKTAYQAFCIVCHGPTGQGSALGKPLNAGPALTMTDAQLRDIVAKGRPDKGMPGFATGLTADEIQAVTRYVRELQRRTQEKNPASANVRRGEALFNGEARCIQCHSYFTRGGVVGPALDGFASRVSEAEIREAVLAPSKKIAAGWQGKEIVTNDGTTIRALSRFETDESIQLLNEHSMLWTTYFKRDLQSIKDMDGSIMPEGLLDDLSPHDRESLFAFLATLK